MWFALGGRRSLGCIDVSYAFVSLKDFTRNNRQIAVTAHNLTKKIDAQLRLQMQVILQWINRTHFSMLVVKLVDCETQLCINMHTPFGKIFRYAAFRFTHIIAHRTYILKYLHISSAFWTFCSVASASKQTCECSSLIFASECALTNTRILLVLLLLLLLQLHEKRTPAVRATTTHKHWVLGDFIRRRCRSKTEDTTQIQGSDCRQLSSSSFRKGKRWQVRRVVGVSVCRIGRESTRPDDRTKQYYTYSSSSSRSYSHLYKTRYIYNIYIYADGRCVCEILLILHTSTQFMFNL